MMEEKKRTRRIVLVCLDCTTAYLELGAEAITDSSNPTQGTCGRCGGSGWCHRWYAPKDRANANERGKA